MEFSTKHKFIYFAIPKTGSTSIRKNLQQHTTKIDIRNFYHLINYDPLHINQDTARKIFSESGIYIKDSFFEFTFVRNPYEKVISHISYGINTTLDKPNHPIDYNNIDRILDIYEQNILHDNWIGKNNSYYMFCKQTYWTKNPLTKTIKVYKYEELESAYEDIKNKLQLDLPKLPVSNRTGNKIILNQNQKARVYDLLKEDFMTFGYSK